MKFSNIVDLGNNRITNLTDPTGAQDGATKNYVDLYRSMVTVTQQALGTGQSIPNITDTQIAWDTLAGRIGTATWWTSATPNVITIPFGGAYEHDLVVYIPSSTVGTRRLVHIHHGSGTINTANFLDGDGCAPNSTELGQIVRLRTVLNHSANDLLVAALWQDTGGAINLAKAWSGYPYARWSIRYLG